MKPENVIVGMATTEWAGESPTIFVRTQTVRVKPDKWFVHNLQTPSIPF